MKKLLFLFAAFFLLFACKKEKNNDDEVKSVKVKYEALIDDAANYQIRVAYMNEHGSPLQVVTVDSPFTYEMTITENGTYLYLSVLSVLRTGGKANENKQLTARIYIDGKLYKQDTSNLTAGVQDVYTFE